MYIFLSLCVAFGIVFLLLTTYMMRRSDRILAAQIDNWLEEKDWDWPLAPDLSHRRGIAHTSRGEAVDFKKYLIEKKLDAR